MSLFRHCEETTNKFCIQSWFSFLWLPITVPVYFIVIFTLIKYRKSDDFDHSFFQFLLSLGIADVLHLLSSYGFRFAIWGWFEKFYRSYGSGIIRWTNVLVLGSMTAQIICVFAIALNRFATIFFPFRHNILWTRRSRKICIAAQWIVAVIFVAPLTSSNVEVQPLNVENERMVLDWRNSCPLAYYYIIWSGFAFVCATLTLFMYSAVFARTWLDLKTSRQTAGQVSGERVNAPAVVMKLFLCALVITGGLMGMSILFLYSQLKWYYHGKAMSPNLYWYCRFILVDMYAGLNPFIVLIMSSKVRNKVKELLISWKKMLTSVKFWANLLSASYDWTRMTIPVEYRKYGNMDAK